MRQGYTWEIWEHDHGGSREEVRGRLERYYSVGFALVLWTKSPLGGIEDGKSVAADTAAAAAFAVGSGMYSMNKLKALGKVRILASLEGWYRRCLEGSATILLLPLRSARSG